jgi:hypothetical protein
MQMQGMAEPLTTHQMAEVAAGVARGLTEAAILITMLRNT